MLNEFYGDILPAQGYFCLFLLPESRHIWAESHEELIELTEQHADRTGVYCGTSAYDTVANRKQSNVLSLRSLRLDIDAGEKKYAKDPAGTYPTQRDALAAFVAFTKATALAPSYLIASGEGLHIYYCLAADIKPDAWMALAEGLSQLAAEHGLKVDPTVTKDTARILRPPGSLHGNGKRVTVLKRTGRVYQPDELPSAVVLPAPSAAPRRSSINDDIVGSGAFQGPPSSALKVAEHCGALREVAASRGDVAEPLWRAMIGLVKRTVEGLDIAQEWSSGYDGYDGYEVERKFNAWSTGPTTCGEFAKHSSACASCAYRGKVKSPINLGLMTTPEIEQLPEETQAAVAVLEPALPKAAPGKPWDGCMPAAFEVVQTKAGLPVLVYSLKVEKESDTGEVVPAVVNIPFTYDIFWFGQWAEADGTDDTAQVTLHLWTGTGVKTYLLDQSLVASPFKLLEYLSGKAIHTTTHKRASQAMQDYAKAQLQRIKSVSKRPKVNDHLGLRILDDGELVCAHGAHVIYADGSIQKAMLGASLRTTAEQFPLPIPESFSGTWAPSVWDDHVMPLARQHVGFLQKYYSREGMEKFQLAIMMGLASPFMAFVTGEFFQGSSLPRMSALSVSLFSRESARGKTTACMSALLAYGKPSGLTNDSGKAGTTDNARVSGLSIFGTMPNVMDEMGGATPASVAGIISAVANGSGKARSKQDGGLSSSIPWALVNLVTTNTSQRDMISAIQNDSGAIQYRLLELNVEGVPEYDQATRDAFSADWAKLNRQCTGALGAVIHREICALGVERANKLVADCCAKASAAVKADQSARFQYRGLGALLALHLLLTRLGLAPFALGPMVEAFKVAHESGRDFVVDNVLPTDGLQLLSRVLQEMAPNTLVTEAETKVNQHSTKFDMPLNARVPEVVHARHVKELGRTYLSVNALRAWCLKHGVSEPEIVRTARRDGVLVSHDRLKGPKGTERKVVSVSAEYYNLAKGLRDSMELKCRVYTVNVRKLFQLLGAEPEDFTGNVVALHGAVAAEEEDQPTQDAAA